jgi:hypothetical protein
LIAGTGTGKRTTTTFPVILQPIPLRPESLASFSSSTDHYSIPTPPSEAAGNPFGTQSTFFGDKFHFCPSFRLESNNLFLEAKNTIQSTHFPLILFGYFFYFSIPKKEFSAYKKFSIIINICSEAHRHIAETPMPPSTSKTIRNGLPHHQPRLVHSRPPLRFDRSFLEDRSNQLKLVQIVRQTNPA